MTEERRRTMAILARVSTKEVAAIFDQLGTLPAVADVRPPESGLLMVQGRIGAEGARFNVGEAAVSRATVRLADGTIGYAYVLGRDQVKARHMAVLDALVQSDGWASRLNPALERLEADTADAERSRAARVAATRVDFFTVARGED